MIIKGKRRVNIKLDMTPMVDIAFLLLIFYMATTQFKPPEKRDVNLPESAAMAEQPDQNMFTITVPENDSIFIDFVTSRKMAAEDGIVSDAIFRKVISVSQKQADLVGRAVQQMRVDEVNYVKSNYTGRDTEAIIENIWNTPIVIKSDRKVEYGIMEALMYSLRDANLATFKILTELEPEIKEGILDG